MSAYYTLISRQKADDSSVIAEYQANIHCQGAWNAHEQHMAPASGLMSYELELFEPRDDMVYGRISYDIMGLIPLKNFTVTTRSIRPGKTIELIESTLSCDGKVAIAARAWRLIQSDTSAIATSEDQAIVSRDKMKKRPEIAEVWAGGYINSVKDHLHTSIDRRNGSSQSWLSNDLEMVEGIKTSPFVKLIGMVDTNNGLAIAQEAPFSHMFPNVDLQIHLYRMPKGQWLGLDTRQQYGANGVGLTSAVLHDEEGPFGHSEQILTVRPMPK